jgi:hypothetical protein
MSASHVGSVAPIIVGSINHITTVKHVALSITSRKYLNSLHKKD